MAATNMRNILFFLIGLLLVACDRAPPEQPLRYSTTPASVASPTYRFAVHPLHNPKKLSDAYQPLIDYLNRQMPAVRFALEASRDYHAYEEKFRARAPDILLPNPWHALEAMKVGYHVIAMAGDAEDFKGIFIVRQDLITYQLPIVYEKRATGDRFVGIASGEAARA